MNNGFYEFSRGSQETTTTSSVFPYTGSAIISGSLILSGSAIATRGFTGSLFGTASQAVSASWAPLNAGGSNTQIQFNSGNRLLGTGSFTFNLQSQSLQQGNAVTASGLYSHAEGDQTIALGGASHAEGKSTQALGNASHAEGFGAISSGENSHAEGNNTISSGSSSHAEGITTIAIGNASHAEGRLTTSSGDYSHAEGATTIASGSYSHAEGDQTIALGGASHAEGRGTQAIGVYSHAEGIGTQAIGANSHAEGTSTIASGSSSHAEGLGTIAQGDYQHAQGRYNILSSAQSAFIIGNGLNSDNRSNLVFASGSTFQITGSLRVSGSITGSLFGTSSFAVSSSFASTASFAPAYLPLTGGTISGSLIITNDLTVIGSASIQYVSQSTLNIGTNLITLNTFNPTARFGGLAIIDSGSSPQVSASFLYDSVEDEFIFVHRGSSTSAVTSSHFLVGPETYNNVGNEIYLTLNRIPKSLGNEHLNDSNISDDGSVVSINSNTQITGSLIVTQGITGSLTGTASFAQTASFAPNYVLTSTTSSMSVLSSSFAHTASFALNAGSGGTSLGLVQAMTIGLQNIF